MVQKLLLLKNSRAISKQGSEGFTLVELLIVVVIIGILSAVGIPAYLRQANTAKINAAKTGASNAARACVAALAASDTAFTLPANTGGSCASGAQTITFTGDGYTGQALITSGGEVQAATVK